MKGRELAMSLWERLPKSGKAAAKRAWSVYARLTSSRRLLPDFIIIGTQRGGTTSLYKYLVRQPGIGRALTKEVRFFDLHYERGLEWYRAQFPSRATRDRVLRTTGTRLMVGEASPDYMFDPRAPERIARTLPDARFIVMLRDPVERAYSHYWHQVRLGFETLSFEEAIEREPERLEGERARVLADESYKSYEYDHHSYLARGRYAEQLEEWFTLFPRDRFFIVRSEDFFADPRSAYFLTLEFLRVPPRDLGEYPVFNRMRSGAITADLRKRLVEYFRPHNRRLSELLGWDPRWD